jgi:hypothetical protein
VGAGTAVALVSVLRLAAALLLFGALGIGCRGPSPRVDLSDGFETARLGQALLPDARIDWGLSPRKEVGAWAWPDRRVACRGRWSISSTTTS